MAYTWRRAHQRLVGGDGSTVPDEDSAALRDLMDPDYSRLPVFVPRHPAERV